MILFFFKQKALAESQGGGERTVIVLLPAFCLAWWLHFYVLIRSEITQFRSVLCPHTCLPTARLTGEIIVTTHKFIKSYRNCQILDYNLHLFSISTRNCTNFSVSPLVIKFNHNRILIVSYQHCILPPTLAPVGNLFRKLT